MDKDRTNTIKSLHSSKERSALEVAQETKTKIDEGDEKIHAFLEVYDEPVITDTKEKSMLTGIPFAIKDNILVKGKTVSAASKILEGYKATYDATVITRLKNVGASLIGRTNMDEFAMGGSTENSAFGPTKNPRSLQHVPGGSSGGSAAAVAAGFVPVALGSDTGGSIRQPASYCGLVGLKPTYGAVSRHGLIAMGSSLDQIGPITTTVTDAETVFSVIRGHDPKDSTTLPDEVWQTTSSPVKTIGVPWDIIRTKGVDDDVIADMEKNTERFKELGYTVVDVSLEHISYALSVYYILMPAEVSANMARFDGVRYGLSREGKDLIEDYTKTRGDGLGEEVKRRIMLGTYVLSSGYYDAYYRSARQARQLIRQEFTDTFKNVDVIALPTTPSPAFRLGEKKNDPLEMYMEDIFTVPANVAGVPALSIPSGTSVKDGKELPLGLQLIAPHTKEDRLFEVGKTFLGEV